MSGIVIRSFADAEERVTFEGGHVDLVTASSLALGRVVLDPGWRWSTHLAARIMAAAGPGEVFASANVRELASGAGIDFEDRGSFELKGFAGARQPFQVWGS